MLSRIKSLFENANSGDRNSSAKAFAERELAAAALMVEAANLDGSFDNAEAATIRRLAVERFGLSDEEAEELLEEARTEQDGSAQILRFTRAVKDHCDEAERIEIIECLWEVAYADGIIHDYEANLIRRVAGLIYVPDRDSGAARRRVLKRLGISN